MSVTKLTVSRSEAYKNLETSTDRAIFAIITKELKRLTKMNIEEKRNYMTDKESYIYQYKLVSSGLVKLANEIVDQATDIVSQLAANGDFTLNQSFNKEVGYYGVRRSRIVRKLIDVLPLIPRNIARYNEATYYMLFGPCSEYDYQSITYIPKSELVEICGEHSNTDYKVVLDALRITGYIKTPVNKWFFTPDEVTEDGDRIHKKTGCAKPIWVDSEKLDLITKASTSKMTYIDAEDCYDSKIEQLSSSSDEILAAVTSLLCLIPSDSIYLSALERVRKPAKLVRVKEGYEFTNKERMNGKLVKYEVIDSIRLKVVDKVDNCVYMNFAYTPSLSIKSMAESNIYELLRFTVDDYSGRLHTVLTRLKREFKNHLIFINGSRVADVDIRACQPTILLAVLAQKGFPELRDLTKDTDFYLVFNRIMKEQNFLEGENTTYYLNDKDREKAKQNCMQVLFSNQSRFNQFVNKVGSLIDVKTSYEKGQEFRKLMLMMGDGSHPYNAEDGMQISDRYVVNYNTGDIVRKPVSTIPKRMQSLEVRMMFGANGVIQSLNSSNINLATTIHDAVLVEEQHADITKMSMESIFRHNLNAEGPSNSSVKAKVTILQASTEEGKELSLSW